MKSRAERAKRNPTTLPRNTGTKAISDRRQTARVAEGNAVAVETSWAKADWFLQWERVARREA
jgi:hypothetical protein